MVRIAAHRGNAYHAPGNSSFALVSAFTGGADLLEVDVQMSRDGELVVAANVPLESISNGTGAVSDLTQDQLHKLDLGARFTVRGSQALTWTRDPPHVRIESLGNVLDDIPIGARLLLEAHLTGLAQPKDLVKKIVAALRRRGSIDRSILASTNADVLKAARLVEPELPLFRVYKEGEAAPDVDSAGADQVDGLVLPLELILNPSNQPLDLAKLLTEMTGNGKIPLGVIVRAPAANEIFSADQFKALSALKFVNAFSTASVIETNNLLPAPRTLEDCKFEGQDERVSRIRFGYAKANTYAHVFQDDGVHIKIKPYHEPPDIAAPATSDPVQQQLNDLQEAAWAAQMNWPFYSGGGFGTNFGIDGDFTAEVDYRSTTTSQATMLEMACVNVDPSKHMPGFRDENGKKVPNTPQSFRDASSFFNPHGAPPFVGVEHDEDDGYRINWNLGSEYDNNQYGRPHGDGNTKVGRFRLERRGAYFSAYYKDEQNPDWVCIGTCRNESMNRQVFIRCAGKRWRQEDITPGATNPYFPIVENHFTFKNFVVTTTNKE